MVVAKGKSQVNVALTVDIVRKLDYLGAKMNRPRTYVISRLIERAAQQMQEKQAKEGPSDDHQ